MPRYTMPPLSKSYSSPILHYLIRHPCSSAFDVIYAIGGSGSTIRARLTELCDEEEIIDYYIYHPRFKAIKLLDNNILADMENFREIIEFCKKFNLKVDFSQGLDARLLNEESAQLLSTVRPMKCWDFAFDSLNYEPYVRRAINLLKNAGINLRNSVQFYVYCNKSDGEYGFDSALKRCEILKKEGTNPYVMLDIDSEPTREMKDLKRWANRKHIFWSCGFKDYKKVML